MNVRVRVTRFLKVAVVVVSAYGWAADASAGDWTNTASMSSARGNHTATLLNDGRVLVAGPHASAEIFDPTSSTFIATVAWLAPAATAVTPLPCLTMEEYCLWVGCSSWTEEIQADLATAELWDPNTGSWTATGTLGMARRNHTATLLPDGRVTSGLSIALLILSARSAAGRTAAAMRGWL